MTDRKFHILDGFPRSVSPSSHASEADGFVFLTGSSGAISTILTNRCPTVFGRRPIRR
jgi:hypothetical protein